MDNSITVENYPYFELKISKRGKCLDIAHIEYEKDGKIKEKAFVMLSEFAVKKLLEFVKQKNV